MVGWYAKYRTDSNGISYIDLSTIHLGQSQKHPQTAVVYSTKQLYTATHCTWTSYNTCISYSDCYALKLENKLI